MNEELKQAIETLKKYGYKALNLNGRDELCSIVANDREIQRCWNDEPIPHDDMNHLTEAAIDAALSTDFDYNLERLIKEYYDLD